MSTILIIDDNPAVATALEVLFSLHDIDPLHAESPAAGIMREIVRTLFDRSGVPLTGGEPAAAKTI